ncbi:MAG: acyl-CoA thioesterase [Rhodoferax sp.]|nr:acyl-CoA thioesterase [Rhodoferax sp.]MCF8208733.1 acyl-CoA thioesterase [Rhodoferax sp.]
MKLELPPLKRLVHTTVTPIRWGDMDAMGHVNNTLYLRYMETARIELMEKNGFRTNPHGHGFVIANIFCNFLRQLEHPGEVMIKSYVGTIGRSSFDMYHELMRTDDSSTVYANGGETMVWMDFPGQKSLPLPSLLREWLTG